MTDIKIILGSHAHPDHQAGRCPRQGGDRRRDGHGHGTGRAGTQDG